MSNSNTIKRTIELWVVFCFFLIYKIQWVIKFPRILEIFDLHLPKKCSHFILLISIRQGLNSEGKKKTQDASSPINAAVGWFPTEAEQRNQGVPLYLYAGRDRRLCGPLLLPLKAETQLCTVQCKTFYFVSCHFYVHMNDKIGHKRVPNDICVLKFILRLMILCFSRLSTKPLHPPQKAPLL